MKPDKSIMKENKVLNENKKKIQNLNNQIAKLNNRKKKIRTQFINELLGIDDYREMSNEIDNSLKSLNTSLSNIEQTLNEEKEEFTFDEIKDLVSNIKLNWEYLTNKEKQQFLERFVDNIQVTKMTDSQELIINSVKFKR